MEDGGTAGIAVDTNPGGLGELSMICSGILDSVVWRLILFGEQIFGFAKKLKKVEVNKHTPDPAVVGLGTVKVPVTLVYPVPMSTAPAQLEL